MRYLVILFLFFSSLTYGQSLYPLMDSLTINKAIKGEKDVRIRAFRNGNDPLKDIQISKLFQVFKDSISKDTIGGMGRELWIVQDTSGDWLTMDTINLNAGIKLTNGVNASWDILGAKELSLTNTAPDLPITLNGTSSVTVTGTYPSYTLSSPNQTLSLLSGGGTLKLTKNGSVSDFVQLRDSSATNEIQTLSILAGKGTLKLTNPNSASTFVQLADSSSTNEIQALSIFAGKGTIKLTNPGSASTFIQLGDSSSTNEIELPTQTGNAGKFLSTNGTIPSWTTNPLGTVTSVAATAPSAGFTISGSPIATSGTFGFTLSDDLAGLESMSGTGYVIRTGTNTYANRTITASAGELSISNGSATSGNTILGLANTPVMAGTYGSATQVPVYTVDAFGRITASNNVTITAIDGSITNEGMLSVGAGTATTSLIKSNTSTSPDITIESGSNISLAESGNKITISASGSSTKEAKKSDRLGIIVSIDSVGFDYKKLVKDDYPDSLMFVPVFDSSENRNKKIDLSYLDYDPYAQTFAEAEFNLSLVGTVDSTIRLDEGSRYLWNYSKSTGEFTYIGSKTLVFKVDAGINSKYTTVNGSANTMKLWQYNGGWGVANSSYAFNVGTYPPALSFNTSRLLQINPGDRLKITMNSTNTSTMVITYGYFNIVMVSRHIGY